MKNYLISFCLLIVFTACNTTKTAMRTSENDAATHQAELSAKYLDAKRTILPPEKLAKLQKLLAKLALKLLLLVLKALLPPLLLRWL